MKVLLQTVTLSLLMFSMPTFAALEDISIMALGAVDGRAVVKTKDGKMKILKVGDTVPTSKVVVKQILNDRLVVEKIITTKDKNNKVIKERQKIWLFKPSKAGGKTRIQRLKSKGSEQKLTKPNARRMSIGDKNKVVNKK